MIDSLKEQLEKVHASDSHPSHYDLRMSAELLAFLLGCMGYTAMQSDTDKADRDALWQELDKRIEGISDEFEEVFPDDEFSGLLRRQFPDLKFLHEDY